MSVKPVVVHDDVDNVAGYDIADIPAIASIETRIIDVPTTRKHKLSNLAIRHQSYTHIRVALSDGSIGYGEASTLGGPRWAEESVESIKSTIDTYLAPALEGQPAADFAANAIRMEKAASRNFSAKAGLDAAVFDAVGHALGLPAHRLLGGAVNKSFEVLWVMASGDPDQEIEEAKAKIAAREHRTFKIKIGFDTPENDMRRLEKIAGALPGHTLILDVNQGWSEATTRRYLPRIEEMGVALVEQPLPAGQMEAFARVTAMSNVPMMIDEGAFTPADIAHAGACHAADVLSLKLVKSGGLLNMRNIAAIALSHGLELYGGCLLESGLGAAAHLAVFSTLPRLEWGTEHFGPKILSRDTVINGPVFRDFEIHLPEGPGLGVTLNDSLIDGFARSEYTRRG